MTKVTKSIEIEVPQEKVFAFISDQERLNELSEGSSEAECASKGPVGVGNLAEQSGVALSGAKARCRRRTDVTNTMEGGESVWSFS